MEIREFTADRVAIDDNEHFVAAALTHSASGRYLELRRSADRSDDQDWGIFAQLDGGLSRISKCTVTRQSVCVVLHDTPAFQRTYQAIRVNLNVDDIQFQHYASMLGQVFLRRRDLLELDLDDTLLAQLHQAQVVHSRLQFSLARMLMSCALASLAFATALLVLQNVRSTAIQHGILPHELCGTDYVWAAWPLLSLLAAAAGLLVKGGSGALRWGFVVGTLWGAVLLLRSLALSFPS